MRKFEDLDIKNFWHGFKEYPLSLAGLSIGLWEWGAGTSKSASEINRALNFR
jgi:hypothetical protein